MRCDTKCPINYKQYNNKFVILQVDSGARYYGKFHTHSAVKVSLSPCSPMIKGTNNVYGTGQVRFFSVKTIKQITQEEQN